MYVKSCEDWRLAGSDQGQVRNREASHGVVESTPGNEGRVGSNTAGRASIQFI